MRRAIALSAAAVLATVLSTTRVATQSPRAVLFEGARLIAGDGSAPIDDSALLVENGSITRTATPAEAAAGRRRFSASRSTTE